MIKTASRKKIKIIPLVPTIFPGLILLVFFTVLATPGLTATTQTTTKRPQKNTVKEQNDNEPRFSSVEQRRVLQALQHERQGLIQERRELENRKKELKRLAAEVDKKLDQLEQTRLQIKKLLAEKDAREQKRIRDLSKMYAKMSPEKAARIMSALDKKLAIDLLADMKTKAAAKILNNMDKDKAAQLSSAFTSLN